MYVPTYIHTLHAQFIKKGFYLNFFICLISEPHVLKMFFFLFFHILHIKLVLGLVCWKTEMKQRMNDAILQASFFLSPFCPIPNHLSRKRRKFY